MVSPLLVAVWSAGLVAAWRRPAWRALRFIPVTYAAAGVVYLITNGHAYYLASLYPLLLGLGSVPTDEWLGTRRRRGLALAAAIGASAVISGAIALPLLPARDLQGSVVMALNPAQGETVGWPQFMATVDRAWRGLPAAVRPATAIFTANYGEAGAIELWGPARGLPRAYSGHNGFAAWGIPPASDRYALVVGFAGPGAAAPQFRRCRVRAVVHNGLGLDNQEQGMPIMLCTTARPWARLWASLRHLD